MKKHILPNPEFARFYRYGMSKLCSECSSARLKNHHPTLRNISKPLCPGWVCFFYMGAYLFFAWWMYRTSIP
jgi:hypothetical protein